MRSRRDWLTLLSDIDFDRGVARRVFPADIFDGVMGQCSTSSKAFKKLGARFVLTCLNTHIDHLIETLDAEHRAIGFTGHHSFHPGMRRRALSEIHRADIIRVNSELAKRTFVERGTPAEKVRVIRPAIDHSRFYPVEKPDLIFRVLMVATVEPRKGVHYLLQAFQEARIPNSELLIIGSTGDRWSKRMLDGYLRNNSNIRVRTLDVMTAPIEETYGAASVLVHPALEDGYGLVIPQALAAGRPVIATKQTGASELIQDGKNGFVIESRSVQDLKTRLQALAADHTLLESMSKAARPSVLHLTQENFTAEVLSMYRELGLNAG